MNIRPSEEVLYLNGLERDKAGIPERLLARYLKCRSIEMTHGLLGWHSGIPFPELFEQTLIQARELLHTKGRLALVGASAGGSMAVNVFQQLRHEDQNADVVLVTLSAWLRAGDLDRLRSAALHRPGKRPSPAFEDSVIRCEEIAIPGLTMPDKIRTRTLRPRGDPIVPLSVMGIEGVPQGMLPISGHVPSIALGLLRLSSTIRQIRSGLLIE